MIRFVDYFGEVVDAIADNLQHFGILGKVFWIKPLLIGLTKPCII